jgi:undecaprenyl-phosphate 4-deoxy-4-formamido-L-arabinose transferase
VRLSIVVPCYRSAKILPDLLSQLNIALDALVNSEEISEAEVLLVVDGSPDDTEQIARECATMSTRVRVLVLRRNFGQHNALIAGIRAANNEFIVTMDDDLQHPPHEIAKLVQTIRNSDADLVYAVPEKEEHGPFRSASSRFVKHALALVGVANAEIVGAFRIFRTDLRDGFLASEDPQVNLDVLLSWTTNRVNKVAVQMNQRKVGRSGYSLPKLIAHTLNMVTGYGTVPLRVTTWLGFICGVFGLILLSWVLLQYAFGYTEVPGFTTLAAIISLFSGAQLMALGTIGEYVGRQHFRSMHRPMYVLRPEIDD